jgi:DNA-binding response OmpR family regulator
MKNVLLVEDDKLVSSIYKNKLSFEGYNVQVALDGEHALNLLPSFKPDIMVLDLMLPKVSGIEVLRHVRSVEETKRLPVIVFTNTYMASMIHEAYACGATKCLCKASCTPKELIDTVRHHAAPVDGAPDRLSPSLPSFGSHGNSAAVLDEREFQRSLCQNFRQALQQHAGQFRSLLQKVCRAETPEEKVATWDEMARKAHSVASTASICELTQLALLAEAFEALLHNLKDPARLTSSSLRTIASVVDCFSYVHQHGFPAGPGFSRANVLVVDDDLISRKAAVRALKRVGLHAFSVADPAVALAFADENSFDLILLDVDMPGTNGFELCVKLRNLKLHCKTPIVFVTCHDDFANRATSTKAGGTDFIGKPFCAMELALRTFVHVLKGQVLDPQAAGKSPGSSLASTGDPTPCATAPGPGPG